MKMRFMFGLGAVLALSVASQAHAELEYGGYFRSGTGFNSLGGKQKCFTNTGTSGNEFRLGNECGSYGEASFTYNFAKGKAKESFFKAVTTFAYIPAANTFYEGTSGNPQPIEIYVEGGYVDGLPFTFWAGKRFYRASDIHMDDFRYYVNMNGNGGGLGSLNLGFADLAVAVLQETTTKTGTPDYTNTTIGAPSKQALDLQLSNMLSGNLEAWLAVAQVNPAATSTGSSVDQQSGLGVGARYSMKFDKLDNKFVVMYGNGVMENLKMDISDSYITNTKDVVKKYARTRVADVLSGSITNSLDLEAALVYETTSNVAADSKSTSWTSFGLRPTYFFSDNVSWVFEAGMSSYKDDNASKTYSLTRLTTGPQISFKRGQYARPVVRAYVTNTSWNDDFKSTLSSDLAYSDKKSATNFGVQAEVWF